MLNRGPDGARIVLGSFPDRARIVPGSYPNKPDFDGVLMPTLAPKTKAHSSFLWADLASRRSKAPTRQGLGAMAEGSAPSMPAPGADPGAAGAPHGGEGDSQGPIRLPSREEMMMQDVMNNCVVKSALSGVIGELENCERELPQLSFAF